MRRIAFILVACAVPLAIFACKKSPPPPPQANDATASLTADAAVVAIADAGTDTPARAEHPKPAPIPPPAGARDVETNPPPAARSARPTDWSDATDLLAHGSHSCTALLKREWVKITCADMASVTLLGGSVEGVMVDVHEKGPDPDAGEMFGQPRREVTGVAIFPLRRGDRRVLQFNSFHQGMMGGYNSTPDEQGPGVTLSELWLEGDKGPRLEID